MTALSLSTFASMMEENEFGGEKFFDNKTTKQIYQQYPEITRILYPITELCF